ncbi:MAG TPA: ATP-binding cassette domain-containing protein [Bacilli bacterium]|nr:ATP-binding cassette domain-containing protein [Bacilli bacterium]HQC84132.1 ATP-binding cassette domain-containing protein [Bacilli bacterium]
MIEISVSNVQKSFGFKRVLDGFDLEASTGERIVLIGPNSSGKTTLFNIIMGEESLDKGMVATRRATIGMLSQIPPKVSDYITVRDILLKTFKDVFEASEYEYRNGDYQLGLKITKMD